MRSMKRHEVHIPVSPETKSPGNANLQRRGFLLTLGVGSAGAAALAVHKLSGNVVAPNDARDSDANAAGYRLTEHVRRYYQTTKL